MVTDVVELTAVVVTVKVAVVAPAATVTLAGTVAEALLLPSVTTAPPVGAALLSVTVPVEEVPPVTVVGLRLTEDSVSAEASGSTGKIGLVYSTIKSSK
jgi:hypothetical protein